MYRLAIAWSLFICCLGFVARGSFDESKPVVTESGSSTEVPDFLPKDSNPVPGLKLANARAFQREKSLLLVLDKVPDDGLVSMPRMCNVVESVGWLDGDPEKPLTLLSEISEWSIKLTDIPDGRPRVLELQLDAEARLFDDAVIASAGDDGAISLPAKFARTTGEKLRFEPQPHKNTVGYWTAENDTVEWWFKVDKPGDYQVEIFQGCGKDQGGSEVDVVVGDQTLSFVVKDTGHFQNFVWRKLGRVTLERSEKSVLKIVATRKAVNAVMDARELRLVPVE